jgi:hypothetical protein
MKISLSSKYLAPIVLLALAVTPSWASIITLNTGTDPFQITADTTNQIPGPETAVNIINLGDSWGTGPAAWIGPKSDESNASNPDTLYFGTDTYQITFSLAAAPTAANLAISLLADDYVDVTLNGNSIFTHTSTAMYTNGSGASFVTTNLADFVAGTNVLDFTVTNSGGGPTGLNASIDGTFSTATPEPATMFPVGLVLIGAGFLLRRRKAAVV